MDTQFHHLSDAVALRRTLSRVARAVALALFAIGSSRAQAGGRPWFNNRAVINGRHLSQVGQWSLRAIGRDKSGARMFRPVDNPAVADFALTRLRLRSADGGEALFHFGLGRRSMVMVAESFLKRFGYELGLNEPALPPNHAAGVDELVNEFLAVSSASLKRAARRRVPIVLTTHGDLGVLAGVGPLDTLVPLLGELEGAAAALLPRAAKRGSLFIVHACDARMVCQVLAEYWPKTVPYGIGGPARAEGITLAALGQPGISYDLYLPFQRQ